MYLHHSGFHKVQKHLQSYWKIGLECATSNQQESNPEEQYVK